MKLKKYQTETEPNIPSSSSSTSSLNSLITNSQHNQLKNNSHSYHQILGAQNRVQPNQVNFSLNSLCTRSTRIATSQSMNFHINLSSNPSVLLNCNSCGKNILEKLNSLSGSMNSNSACHDTSLIWCLNCYKFLPQCVVCLSLMKVNVAPSYPVSVSQSTMNRVQTTPKMYRSEFDAKKILAHNKSPSQLDLHGSVDRNFYLDEYGDSQRLNLHEIRKEISQRKSQMNKVEILFTNNFYILKSTRFGNWFSWCMSCHHGGHIKHLMNWFRSNKKCPYLHCKCQCTNLDFIIE